MADQNIDSMKGDAENAYSTPGADPKNMQEVTLYVQSLLQNMQDKFQSMSDQIINRIDEMGTRVDELEKTVTDLMTQAGIEGLRPQCRLCGCRFRQPDGLTVKYKNKILL